MTIILPKNTAVATLCNSTLKLPIDMYSRLPNKRVLLDSFDFFFGLIWAPSERDLSIHLWDVAQCALAFLGMVLPGCSLRPRGYKHS